MYRQIARLMAWKIVGQRQLLYLMITNVYVFVDLHMVSDNELKHRSVGSVRYAGEESPLGLLREKWQYQDL